MTLTEFIKLSGSQEKAARKLGVSWATVNRWVNQKTKRPSGLALEALRREGVLIA